MPVIPSEGVFNSTTYIYAGDVAAYIQVVELDTPSDGNGAYHH